MAKSAYTVMWWGLASLTYDMVGDVIALLSESLSLLIILKQRFFRFINKALHHSSLIISCVAKISIINPCFICSANYRQILNECGTTYAMSANV